MNVTLLVRSTALGFLGQVLLTGAVSAAALAVSPSTVITGRLQGAITLTNAGQRVTQTFKGAVLQRQNFGSGFFLGTNQSGRVYVGPLFPWVLRS
jgi:hypothetical protein